MSAADVLPPCLITSGDAECYTASWFLIGDQIRYWALFQVPVLALSVIYEWLELSNLPRLEALRTLFDAPMIQVANCIFQIITCIFVCVAWIVRGGALAVSFSLWSVESFLLILTAIGYGGRWIAAKHKVLFTMKLHSLLDLLSLISHFALSFQTYAVDGRERRSWLDFGFLRVYVLYIVIDYLFTRYQHKTFTSQVLLVMFKAWCLVFFAACVLFSLERLGDVTYTNSFLLHVYKCTSLADSSQYVLVNNVTQALADVADCAETWSFFSSIYFMFVTVSTVGYGDFSPKTVLGQLMVCIIIVIGIYTFAHESAALLRIYGDKKGGVVAYSVSRNTAHVIVTGNPSAAQVQDFIREFFHPDHDALFDRGGNTRQASMPASHEDEDDVDPPETTLRRRSSSRRGGGGGGGRGRPSDLEAGQPASTKRALEHQTPLLEESAIQDDSAVLTDKWRRRMGSKRVRETHIVVLMRFDDDGSASDASGSSDGDASTTSSFQEQVAQFVNENPRYQKRVFLIYGSPLKSKDLEHARVDQAMGVFFLPNKFANDGNREDAATVLRVLSVSQHVGREQTRFYAMLVNSENRTLLEASGLSSDNLVCADELRLGLMGLSCRCPGLSTLVSNLITSRSADLPVVDGTLVPTWVKEYVTGAANEIYSCVLAVFFQGMTFTQCAQRIHKQSDGQVLLLAVEFERRTLFNPGHNFRILATCRAFLVAESMTALAPFTDIHCVTTSIGSSISRSHTMRPSMVVGPGEVGYRPRMVSSPRIERKMVAWAKRAQHTVERRLPQPVRAYVTRCGSSIASFRTPMHPPPSLLARGGHIVVCSNVATEGSRSISRLVSFLRPLRAPHVEQIAPVVIVDASQFDSVAWLQLSEFGSVYHVHGSPQRHHVLVNAGVYAASAIVVLAQGTETGYDDSKAIFNAILINQALQQSDIFTIIELRDVHNNKFLDPVPSFSSRPLSHGDRDTLLDDRASLNSPALSTPHRGVPSHRVSSFSRMSTGTGHVTAGGGRMRSSSVASKMPTWWELQRRQLRRAAFFLREFFWGSLHNARTRIQLKASTSAADAATEASGIGLMESLLDDNDTFFQERFMRGALFPSSVADDLLIQSFFNPSLNEFVRKMLDGTSCFMLYSLPKDWRHGTQTYGELFDYLTSGIASALPLGLLRAKGDAPHPYVYTSPPSDTLLNPDDKVFVILDVHAIHRVANKLQRRFRSARRAKAAAAS